ncbi:T9SS type A sorting domain-containing protein [Flavobacterium tegetincola]|uniref:T9SS type A sorting domain-containing protein n=1 Tax=Flavobacterium tegetincola TaxID=150172 RepID=UPI0003F8EE21|nr:T9SS type A sorting domain-containing protein [Flavobacterium tegetincola]
MKKILLLILTAIATTSHAQCYESLTFGGTHTVGIKSDGTLWGWGQGDWRQLATTNFTEPNPIQVSALTSWSKVFPGIQNTFAIKNDGTLWGVGSNLNGSLGVNSSAEYFLTFQQITTATDWLKVAPSYLFTLALKADGTIWAWGQDDNNQTGNPPSSESQLSPIQVGTATDWIDVATSTGRTAFALKADGTIWGWGANTGSLLVAASSVYSLSTPTQITNVNTWARMSVGGSHILAQKADGTLWSWGSGAARGVGENVNPGIIPTQIATEIWKNFSAGGSTSFGVKENGTLWAWGYNPYGDLADGTTTTHYIPVQIGTDTNWDTVQARNFITTMATKTDGSVYYWGRNYNGEFGNGTDYNPGYYTSPQLTPNICVTSLSTPTFEKSAEVKLYPNPVQNRLFIDNQETVQYQIYSILGVKISEGALTVGNNIDCSSFSSGVYLLNLVNNSGNSTTLKFVKQ